MANFNKRAAFYFFLVISAIHASLGREATVVQASSFDARADAAALDAAIRDAGADVKDIIGVLTGRRTPRRQGKARAETIAGGDEKEIRDMLASQGILQRQAVPRTMSVSGTDGKEMIDVFAGRRTAQSREIADSMADGGANKNKIIDILTGRKMAERREIAAVYKGNYGRDLVDDLKRIFSGNVRDFVVALTRPEAYYFAKEFHRAISGIATDEDTVIELLCTLDGRQLRAAAEAYERKYKHRLEDDVEYNTRGSFKKSILVFLNNDRDEADNEDQAESAAMGLHYVGMKKGGGDKSNFYELFATRSYNLLRAIFREYSRISGQKIEEKVESMFSGDTRNLLLSIVNYVESREEFFASRLYASFKGIIRKDRTLIRIMATQSETDLGKINKKMVQLYGVSIEDLIKDKTSGDYQYALRSLFRVSSPSRAIA